MVKREVEEKLTFIPVGEGAAVGSCGAVGGAGVVLMIARTAVERAGALQTARRLREVGPTFSDWTILGTKGMCC